MKKKLFVHSKKIYIVFILFIQWVKNKGTSYPSLIHLMDEMSSIVIYIGVRAENGSPRSAPDAG